MCDDGQLVGIVSMSKAFYVIQHPLLLAKPKAYGLNKDSSALLRDYLSNRQRRVKREVPQGSVLGPIHGVYFLLSSERVNIWYEH